MIFVCAGSRGYQFDRLFREVDRLIEENIIEDQVFGQIGQGTYHPVNYEYAEYLDMEDFRKKQREADLIISHAGTGALVSALKLGKQVIAVPRQSKYGEHIDDHQIQVTMALEEAGYLRGVREIDELGQVLRLTQEQPIRKKYNQPSNVLHLIDLFIQENS